MQLSGQMVDLKERAFVKAPEPIVMYDGKKGTLCAYNDAAVSLLGLPAKENEPIAAEDIFDQQSVDALNSHLHEGDLTNRAIQLTASAAPGGVLEVSAMSVPMGESHKQVLSLYIRSPEASIFGNGSEGLPRAGAEQRLPRNIDNKVISSIDVVCQGFIIYSVLKELLAHQSVSITYHQYPDAYDCETLLNKNSEVLIFAFPNVSNAEIQSLKELMNGDSALRVLVLTMRASDRTLATLIRLGVRGVISEEKDFQLLTAAANAIGNGELWFSRTVLQQIFESLKHSELHRGDQAAIGALSERELEILKLIAVGLKNTQIADKLSISYSTVASHVYNIFRKLDINSRAEAIHYAVSRGLI